MRGLLHRSTSIRPFDFGAEDIKQSRSDSE